MIDQGEFAKVMAVLASMWPRYQLSQQTINAYYAILGDLDVPMLRAATLHLGATATFFPSAGEIRRAAFDLVERKSGVPDGYQAFAEVMRAVGKFGVYRIPEFSHPLVSEAVDAVGGWRTICVTDEGDVGYLRSRFVSAFETLLKRAQTEVRMLPEVRRITAQLAAGDDAPALTAGEQIGAEIERLAQEVTR